MANNTNTKNTNTQATAAAANKLALELARAFGPRRSYSNPNKVATDRHRTHHY